MRAAIDDQTILLVGSAVAYAHGAADPIEAIGRLALDRELLFHVDGCIGAMVLGYLEKLGEEGPAFDFRVPGVSSISMDYHKYGFCPKGSSVVLFRDKNSAQVCDVGGFAMDGLHGDQHHRAKHAKRWTSGSDVGGAARDWRGWLHRVVSSDARHDPQACGRH